MKCTNTILEANDFIILDEYTNIEQLDNGYQTEAELECELIDDLQKQGYEYDGSLSNRESMLKNIKKQLENLNQIRFNDDEWQRFIEKYLDVKNDNHIDKTRKVHNNHKYDFVFDNGWIQNIYLFDKKCLSRNKLQVIKQFKQEGNQANRYDVTILVNGIPMVQIELKKRGVAIREAFNQVYRYSRESLNNDNSLFKYLQIFVISNGTDSRYFANTTTRDKNSFDFTMNWADSKNNLIRDLKDFTATFFEKITLLKILLEYSIFDTKDTLLIMRPYQIAATERVIWNIKSRYNNKINDKKGGYIWHTTGSGKTLTSFKVAKLATELDFIDKVFFVVDRKDLDYQTMKEYQRFCPDSVNGSNSTHGLKNNILRDDNKIIVTTIQKLMRLIKSDNDLEVYNKRVVFIFDEAHRSLYGGFKVNIQNRFKNFYQYGFTGTPIFKDNSIDNQTTEGIFGKQIHTYVLTDAIRDEKVLKFKIDYHSVLPNTDFKAMEQCQDIKKLPQLDNDLLHDSRIKAITDYILNNFNYKTHRTHNSNDGFNAIFAVSSIEAAKKYYEQFKQLQQNRANKLNIVTIFSFSPNEEQNEIIKDESLDINDINNMDKTAKEFLIGTIKDYNTMFESNYNIAEFENYYRDIAKRLKNRDIDLLIVVGMFLTGFDAPTLNTLFVDKNLSYHGLIQAYSRTNRIYDKTKSFGNIVTFRDLEKATKDAIGLFGDSKNSDISNIVIERSYKDYMYGFTDENNGKTTRGYIDIVTQLQSSYPNHESIITDSDKKSFVKLFGEYLRITNKLQNYDEYNQLQQLHSIDINNQDEITKFKQKYNLDDVTLMNMQQIQIIKERDTQNYLSVYRDIMPKLSHLNKNNQDNELDWNDVVFEVELVKSLEVNLDYILGLIFEYKKTNQDKSAVSNEARRLIKINMEAKEDLVVGFIDNVDLNKITDKANILEEFYTFAKIQQEQELIKLIETEGMNRELTIKYISQSLKKGAINENGMGITELLPKMSPLHPNYVTRHEKITNRLKYFVDKFKGIGNVD
jgi:type I restriction enzyme R subunit